MRIHRGGKRRVVGLLAAALLVGGLAGTQAVRGQDVPSVTTSAAARETLQAKLKEAGAFPEKAYSFHSWNALRATTDRARRVADKQDATQKELLTAALDVQAAISGLESRITKPYDGPQLGLGAMPFASSRTGPANNVALQWASQTPFDTYELRRVPRRPAGKEETIYTGTGTSFNDYAVKPGTYLYILTARKGGNTQRTDAPLRIFPSLPEAAVEYSNQTGTGADALWEPLKIGSTYYRFDSEKDGDRSRRYFVQTSPDGKNWTRGPIVLDRSSHPDLADFKFEAVNIFYDEAHDKIVWWCHWERSGGSYGDGKAFVATAKPGERFTVHQIYNPLGVQVRDMSVFVDDDKQGYLVAASNVAGQGANATLYIFKLNSEYTDVTGIVNKAMENEYREAPHIVHRGGIYYLFFSQAAGWYPSRAGYVAARSLDGGWSEPRFIGNSSTFAAQSGPVVVYGQDRTAVPLLVGNRWIRGDGTSANAVVPLTLSGGWVLGDYAPTLLLDRARSRVVPIQVGRLLSQGQPATASLTGSTGHEADKAFDGDYSTSFQSDEKKWPFSVTTDLGAPSAIRNVQISWHIHKGSEAYYKYTIEGSLDGTTWSTLLDRTDDKDTRVSKTYGFSSDLLPDVPTARYVRINVQQAVLHNNPNNWYPPTLYEVKVYGDKKK